MKSLDFILNGRNLLKEIFILSIDDKGPPVLYHYFL
jgi:hypothetical protein